MTAGSRVRALLAAVNIALLGACSGSDDNADTLDTSAPTATAGTEPSSTTEASDDIAAPTPTSTTTPADDIEAPTTTPVDDQPADDETTDTTVEAPTTTVGVIDGVEATIELLTPVAGSGIRPLLEWAPVEGASYYMVVVDAPDGSPYWTWTGGATAVHVGGDPVLADDRPGPSIIDGMTWGIVALDDEIVPIAYSERRAIAP